MIKSVQAPVAVQAREFYTDKSTPSRDTTAQPAGNSL